MTADPADFRDEENWHGGYYELAIDLGARADPGADARLGAALRALWSDPNLDGCYLDRRLSPNDQLAVAPPGPRLTEPSALYGLARLPSGASVVCVTHVVREEQSGQLPAQDWLDLCLPTGALVRADARVGGYPFGDDESLSWRRPIDRWMFRVAEAVFRAAAFRVALVGFEVSGDPAADRIDESVPDERWIGYALPSKDGLQFIAPTR